MSMLKKKQSESEICKINTKFGTVEADLDSAIYFPKGIVGFCKSNYYCITNVPENKLPGAFLLQSLDQQDLCFIILNLPEKLYTGENALINYDDISDAVENFKIGKNNLEIMAIAKISKKDDNIRISINLRAPLFIDIKNKIAYQHVFVKDDYPLAYYLN